MTICTVTAAFKDPRVTNTIESIRAERRKTDGITIKHIVVVPENDQVSRRALKECNFGESSNDEITILESEASGIYTALNLGVSEACTKGEYVTILGAGDTFTKGALSKFIEASNRNPNHGGYYGDLIIAKDEKPYRIWLPGEYDSTNINFGWTPPHTTMFVKATLYRKYPFIVDLDNIPTAADYAHFLHLTRKEKCSFYYIPYPLACMIHGGASCQNPIEVFKQDVYALSNYGGYSKQEAWRIALMKRMTKIYQPLLPYLVGRELMQYVFEGERKRGLTQI